MMFKKILVPLDGSQQAEKVLSYVEKLAAKFDSRVVLLHVVAPTFYYADRVASYVNIDPEMIEFDLQKAERYLRHLQRSLAGKGIKTSTRTECGSAIDIVCKVAREEEIDLIAIAPQRRTGWRRMIPGSITSQVQKRVAVPTLVVHSARVAGSAP